jgi:phage portal protein BeeE
VSSLYSSLRAGQTTQRSTNPIAFQEWVDFFNYNGMNFPLLGQQPLGEKTEEIDASFQGFVRAAYRSNGIVFACNMARLKVFSDARLRFRRFSNGTAGDLFGTTALEPLEKPWQGGTTGDLLARMIQDADMAGNFYGARQLQRDGSYGIRRMRPDWVTIVLGSHSEPEQPVGAFDAEIIGYIYHPGGRNSGRPVTTLLVEQVAHFAPIPDPEADFRGMSWLSPILREIQGDIAASTHKLKFWENGATPNLVVTLGDVVADPETFNKWVDTFEANHEGVLNAYKTLYLGAGANAQALGANLRQADLRSVQGAGETRIAAAAGVPPIIVGLSEGLQAATYSNYGQARRGFGDTTLRYLWRNAAASLAPIIDVPVGAELWYDVSGIAFLREDQKDAAEIQGVESRTIRTLVDAGFKPESVVAAVRAQDWNLLQHTGLFSVQLQPPGAARPPGATAAEMFAADVLNQVRAELPEPEQLAADVLSRVLPQLPAPSTSSNNGH